MACARLWRYKRAMDHGPTATHPQWQARLELGWERRGSATVLARKRHTGPLRVQKALYPEGPQVCHTLLLHPPAGVAAGDALDFDLQLAPGAHAWLGTPGAAKWYRSPGPWARQQVQLRLMDGACCEWLPQETILHDGARACMDLHIHLEGRARALGWDILCLGRTACGEQFTHGELTARTRLWRHDSLLWQERLRVTGGSPALHAAAGYGGWPVSGTLWAAGLEDQQTALAAARACTPPPGVARHALTVLPGVLLARCLARDTESARHWLARIWDCLRPALSGRAAIHPRIWNT